jgi:drug/metabolite transporter (DMT)-like permease
LLFEARKIMSGKNKTRGIAACVIAGSLWGMGFFFGKIALREIAVGHMVLMRFLFACVAMVPVCIRYRPRLTRGEWGLMAASAFLGVPVQFLTQFYGLSMTTVTHASLMVGMLPVMLAVGASMFAGERVDRVGWLALCGSAGGAALITAGVSRVSAGAGGASLKGDLLVVLSMVISLFWILLNQRLMRRHNPVVITALGIFLGTAMLVPWVLPHDGMLPVHISAKCWGALAASGVLCTATTTLLWNYGLTQIPASFAGVFLNLEPLVGTVLGVALLRDTLGASAWIGGGMILGMAVLMTTRPHSHAEDEHMLA